MRFLARMRAFYIAFLFGLTVTGARADNLDSCSPSVKNPDAMIAGCTSALQTLVTKLKRELAVRLTLRGWAWQAKGDARRAALDFTAAINADSGFAPSYEGRANLYRDQNDCARAIPDYNEATRLQPERVQTYLSRGVCLTVLSNTNLALPDLEQVIKLDPKNSGGYAIVAWNAKGMADTQKGDLDQAIADYDHAIGFDAKRADLYLGRGLIWGAKDDTAKALADYDQAIKLDKENAGAVKMAAIVAKAVLHANNRELDRAIQDYGDAITLNPRSAPQYIARGAVWGLKGDDAHALADYGEAIKLDPKSALAYNARGDFFRDRGDYDKAIVDYGNAIANQPGDLTAVGNRALAEFYTGDFPKAATDFKKIVAGQPNTYSSLWLYLSSAHTSPRDASGDLAAATSKITPDWSAPVVQMFLGKKSVDAAVAAAATPDQKCEAQFYSGEWQVLHRAKEPAQKALQTAVDSCPKDFAEYRGAVEEFKRLQ
jgi:tetratricopeptide (TPR) repeat protein